MSHEVIDDDRRIALAHKQLALRGYAAQLERRGDADSVMRARAEMQRIDGELRGGGEHRAAPQIPPDGGVSRDDVEREEQARKGDDNAALQRIRGVSPTAAQARTYAPLSFEVEALKEMHSAAMSGQSRRITSRAFNTADSLLPAQLWPEVIGPLHEGRIMDRLRVFPTERPLVEFIRHNGTTGTPKVVGEGQLKPELVFDISQEIVAVKKIAAHAGVSREIVEDWSNFYSYVQRELTAQVIDTENYELLYGGLSTTPSGIVGFLGTSGILTHVTGGATPLDALETAISKLRVGPALAEPSLLVLHPATWSAIRRSKDGQQRYLVAPDPTAGEANTVWGVPVIPTTTIAAGNGLMVDTNKFGCVHVREPLNLTFGTTQDDFTRNIFRVIAEERIALAVERPAAILAISGLPTS